MFFIKIIFYKIFYNFSLIFLILIFFHETWWRMAFSLANKFFFIFFLFFFEKNVIFGGSEKTRKLGFSVHDLFFSKSWKKTSKIAPLGPCFFEKHEGPHFVFFSVPRLGVGGVQSGGHFFVLKKEDFCRGQKKVCIDFRRWYNTNSGFWGFQNWSKIDWNEIHFRNPSEWSKGPLDLEFGNAYWWSP